MPAIHTFGPFRLDTDAKILFRGAAPLALGQRAVSLLQVLVERAKAPVSKHALIEAAWPGLAVEDSNLTVQIGALRRVFKEESGGARWIETLPRRGYRYVGPAIATEVTDPAASTKEDVVPALKLPDMPSIAILPFQNLSGDSEQEYFADGIVEEIITALTRFKHLFVIARNSSFTYKGRAVDVKQVGRELGVRYVLEGSVRKTAHRVRITGQLVDASLRTHLWADRFEGSLEDIFDLQDRVTAGVVGAIAPKLEQIEIDRAKRKPTESLDAYDNYLRGIAIFHQWTREANNEALRLFYRAIELDPAFASAHGLAAWCLLRRKNSGWMTEHQQDMAEAERLAQRAVELGKDDAVALCSAGFVLGRIGRNLHAGTSLVDRALMHNPNLATAWFISGWVRTYVGEPDVAIEHFTRAMRLNPLDPLIFGMQTGIAASHFLASRYDESSSWAEKAILEHPNWLPAIRMCATSHALAGRLEEAQEAMTRMREIDPVLRVSTLGDLFPFREPEGCARYAEGLRKAGLPE